jgi:hypothetical protein
LRHAQRLAKGVVERIAAAGETTLTVDESGLASAEGATPVSFRDLTEIENAGGLLYIWRSSPDSAPLVVPTRIFADEAEAEQFLVFVRKRISRPHSAHVP